jgi:xanthine dehydrogenase YagS FAD-binding subunit
MKKFTHINASTVAEAASALGQYGDKAAAVAGGTDLLRELNMRVRPEQPEYVVNLKTIAGLDYIEEDSGGLKIGALTRLHDIAFSSVVQSKYSVLAQAARKVASKQVRNMGTISGNITQQVQCWYYRSSFNKFNCLRKPGGTLCYATLGNNRYHSIFGAAEGCISVHPSDTAPALVALDAKIVTNTRTIDAADFFDGLRSTVLDSDEIITEIQVPTPPANSKQSFAKASVRKAIDFAIANVAVVIAPASGSITSARVVLNGVAPTPKRATKAEEALVGNTITDAVADAAAEAAVDGAIALPYNKYKIAVAKGVVKRALLA